jgi:ferredoxin
MKINTLKLIYFSPTRTTRKALEGVAVGIDAVSVSHLDLTLSGAEKSAETVHTDLAILGVPVYAGRVPQIAVSRISKLKAENIPAVIVVVYGNRAYEDALVELKDLAEEAGFKPMAAAAFIGEHSFSSEKTPIAQHRPDEKDIMEADAFGRQIRKKLDEVQDFTGALPLSVPGNHPYKERHQMPPGSPTTQEELCTLCGSCADACPVNAISVGDIVETDAARCIYCCACVKICPTDARVMTIPKMNEIAKWLSETCAERKSPEFFI